MITDLQSSTATGIADAVAAFVGPAIAPGTQLQAGQAVRMPVELPLQYAVLVALGGSVTGELALLVDETFARALVVSDLGELDLADALAPALGAMAVSLGSVVLGVAQTVDARVALARIEGRPDAVLVGLDDGVEIRAAVAVGVDAPGAVRAPASASSTASTATPGAAERLDLLRGVEMAATVELGRAKMTINDLLSLRDGAVIELDRAAGDAADLFVNGRLIARGEIVVVDENYGLRITSIVAGS